jgi:hypothetical protein
MTEKQVLTGSWKNDNPETNYVCSGSNTNLYFIAQLLYKIITCKEKTLWGKFIL